MGIEVSARPLAPPAVGVSFKTPTACAWGASFLLHLDAEMRALDLPERQAISRTVCQQAQTNFDARQPLLPDAAAHTVLGMCALLLEAHQLLVSHLGNA